MAAIQRQVPAAVEADRHGQADGADHHDHRDGLLMAGVMNGGTGAVWARRGGARHDAGELGSGAGPVSSAWPLVSSLTLAALPTAVACGRLHTKVVLWEWQLDHLVDDAMISVSELLSNAITASRRSVGPGALVLLRLLGDHRQLLIEVWDQSPEDPKPRAVELEAEYGRGLQLIEALSKRWGWYRVSERLKVVWCEVADSPDTSRI